MATNRTLFDLDGRTAIVTGGSRGLGLQLVAAPVQRCLDRVLGGRQHLSNIFDGKIKHVPENDGGAFLR